MSQIQIPCPPDGMLLENATRPESLTLPPKLLEKASPGTPGTASPTNAIGVAAGIAAAERGAMSRARKRRRGMEPSYPFYHKSRSEVKNGDAPERRREDHERRRLLDQFARRTF
jgi:hypothetical protein